jgi:Fe2+ transport system protein FeoA
MKRAALVPLTTLTPGQRARLVRIEAGHQVVHRMSELGLTPGVELVVFQRNSRGPLLIAVRDTRLALGRGMADKVLVELIAEVPCCRKGDES